MEKVHCASFVTLEVKHSLTKNVTVYIIYIYINTADARAERWQKEHLFDRLPWLSPCGEFAVAVLISDFASLQLH